nr:MAG TPA: hypothetical protein [Caudoviricetes sp.]
MSRLILLTIAPLRCTHLSSNVSITKYPRPG